MKKNPAGILSGIGHFLSDEKMFRLCFMSALFCASLCIVRFWFYVATGIMMIWAFGLFVYKYLYKQRIRFIHNRRLIYLFLACGLVSCVLHIQDNFFVNMYYLAIIGVYLFFFYGLHGGRSKNSCRKEVRLLMEIIIAATDFIMLVGMILLAIAPTGFVFAGDYFAIKENRFTGVIFNVNVCAFYSLVALLCVNIVWAMRRADGSINKRRRIFYILSALLNTLTTFLCDSNDSLLMMIVYACFVSFYALFRGYHRGIINLLVRIVALALACIVIAMSLLGLRTVVQSATSHLLSLNRPQAQISTGVTAEDGTVYIKPDTEEHNKATSFEHENTNLDSGRFVIWKQSAALYRFYPLFGMGKANIVEYGKRCIGGLKYDDFHNGLITILVGYGAAGFNVFMVFAITVAKSMFKAIFRYRKENRRDGRVLMYLTAFAAGYCAYSMFEVALLADISYRVMIFWMVLGLAMSYVFSYERSALLVHENINDRSRSLYRISTYHSEFGKNGEEG